MAEIDVQVACDTEVLPSEAQLKTWCELALEGDARNSELSLRIVNEEEIQALNCDFRQKNKSTNVLSFPSEVPPELDIPLLGDIVICAAVVDREAAEQSKMREAHWAHMVVHATLHLQGYDHGDEEQAAVMEHRETELITQLGFPKPYEHV